MDRKSLGIALAARSLPILSMPAFGSVVGVRSPQVETRR